MQLLALDPKKGLVSVREIILEKRKYALTKESS